ncbi:hypothetical protein PE067_06580 [Paracoccus sp. DMF-8]|uniref:hypothetical protein n=1 Tax=Paracoccus sp. DMF-8 TaxID=3019445 RepID=UPI0023E8D1F3|nr:hypothetical protein [Paracoccus sp. DMF-8]MDF3605842.1 hypothetical protein [Paracoccus sp. DMF-8]
MFDPHERRQFWLLTVLMILVALVEVVGISSVLMLLNVLAEPASIRDSAILSTLQDRLDLGSTFNFQIFLAISVIVVVVIGLLVKALGSYALTRFSAMRGYTLSSRLLEAYLSQPYSWFLGRNSAEIGKNVLNEADGLVSRVITPALRLVASIFMVIAILGFRCWSIRP